MTNEFKYQCPECSWIGTEDSMEADYVVWEDGDESWSNWICPKCNVWWQLEDYLKIE